MEFVQILIDRSLEEELLCAEFIIKCAANSTMWLIHNLTVSFQIYNLTAL